MAHIESPHVPEVKFFTMLQGSKNKIKEVIMLYCSIRGAMENHLGFHQKGAFRKNWYMETICTSFSDPVTG